MNLRVKEICKQKGMTQKELATLAGITSVGLSKSLSGNTTLATLEKIAAALGVPVSELLEEPAENEARITCPHCGRSVGLIISVKGESVE